MLLEKVVAQIAERLMKSYPDREIFISNSCKGNGVKLGKANRKMIEELSAPGKNVFFRGIEVPKKSWYKVSNFYRTSLNAGVIELCKSLPYFPLADVKNNLLKLTGINLGEDVTIAPRVQFDYFYPELISIGDNTLIGDGARLWTHEYGIDYFGIGEIKIGKNVYIGSEAIIGPSEIGDGSKIKARSLVLYGKDFK